MTFSRHHANRPNIFLAKLSLGFRFFLDQKLFEPKLFLDPKYFGSKIFWTMIKIFSDLNFWGTKIFLGTNFFWVLHFWDPKFGLELKCFWTRYVFLTQNFCTQIFFRPKNLLQGWNVDIDPLNTFTRESSQIKMETFHLGIECGPAQSYLFNFYFG